MSNFNFTDLAKAEYGRRAGQAMATGQEIQSDRGPAKAKPAPQTSSAEKVSRKRAKAEKGRKKDKKAGQLGAQVAGAVGDFAGAVAAGMLQEARQKGVGAGAAAAFAQGVQPIVDFGKIMRGKADPGTVLGRVGKRIMEDNQRFSVGDAAKDAGQAAAEAAAGDEPKNPLDSQPEEKDADNEVKESAKAAVEAATSTTDPLGDVTDFDRRMVITLGMGAENLTDEQIAYGMNALTNRYGAVKAGNMVRHVMENPQQFTTGSVEQ